MNFVKHSFEILQGLLALSALSKCRKTASDSLFDGKLFQLHTSFHRSEFQFLDAIVVLL